MWHRRLSLLVACLILVSIWPAAAQGVDIQRLQQATVLVAQARSVGDELFVSCVGSGTLVSRDGLVLTNAHNTLPSTDCPGETLIIAISGQLGEPPVLRFRAEVAQAELGLDLALLRITRELDGRRIEPGALGLPFVELGDSSQVRLDETITVVGYPGIGNDPIATVRGTVSGFVAEPRGGGKAWIKTSAAIPGIMSGGGAYDQQGRLIGIPTTAPLRFGTGTSCVPIQDTNRDNLINNSDICIPVGGFINALRPSNLARPLLRAASLGLTVSVGGQTGNTWSASGTPGFKRLFFSPAVNEAGMPTTVIRSLPSGSNSLYLFFDYENMTPETVYELRVTIDGIPNPIFSLAPVRWSGGERGMWYIGSSGQPWPNGLYEFTLFANGVASSPARLVVGGAPESVPSISDIVFGLLDLRNNPLGNGYVLPTGNIASARFIYRDLADGLDWVAIWYLNNLEVARETNTWSAGATGSTTTSIRSDEGLPPGSYRLEIYIGDRLSATSDFTIAGAQQGAFPEIFRDIRFVTAPSPAEAAAAVASSNFPNTITDLYVLFSWQQIAPGTLWTVRWLVDREIFFEQTAPWSSAESGDNFLLNVSHPNGIPDGTYRLELLLNNVLLGAVQAQVGIGQLPLDRFAQAEGVQLRGQILDANTREGIPGITLVVISEDFSVNEFVWDQSQVYALAVTDRGGRFQVDRPLNFSVPYSLLVAASGYLPFAADGFVIAPDSSSPLDLTIYLTRD